MPDFKITIFTTTYNRCVEIKKLYNSLREQTNKNFIWLVVDDGSSDETEELFSQILAECNFEIKYIKQENGGKYKAHNKGVIEANTEFFVCVDSDDFLSYNAVEIMNKKIIESNCLKDNKINGIFFPRTCIDSVNNIQFKIKNNLLDIMDLKFLYNKNIETIILIKTDLLKMNLFIEN